MKENEEKQTVTLEISELLELCKSVSAEKDKDKEKEKENRKPGDQSYSSVMSKESQLDFLEMAKVVLKKWWIIALAVIIVSCAAFAYFFSKVTVTYYATAKMFVNNNNNITLGQTSLGGIAFTQVGAASNLMGTYCEIIKTRKTLNAVSVELYENYGYRLSYYELYGMVSAGSIDGTVVFFVQVRNSDPNRAIQIANAIVRVFPSQIESIINGASAKVVDYAEDAVGYSSDVKNRTMLAGAVALIVSVLAIILKDYILNDEISSSEWLAQSYSTLPMLAEIPDVNATHAKNGKYYGYYYYRSYTKKNNNKKSD